LTIPRIDCLGALCVLGLIPTLPPTSTPTATATPTPTPELRAIFQFVAVVVALAMIGQWRAIAKRRPEEP